jgi:hypothetical protein
MRCYRASLQACLVAPIHATAHLKADIKSVTASVKLQPKKKSKNLSGFYNKSEFIIIQVLSSSFLVPLYILMDLQSIGDGSLLGYGSV